MHLASACLLAATLLVSACGREAVALPDTVEVTCENDGTTTLSSRSVRPKADGVHVRLLNKTGRYVRVGGLFGASKAGAHEYVVRVPPGLVEVRCATELGTPSAPVLLVIRDLAMHFVDPEPECPLDEGVSRAVFDFAAPSKGTEVKNEPREFALVIARKGARLRPDDVVEFAGYPEADPPIVRFVREGKTTRTLEFVRLAGRLAVGFESRCTG